MTEERRTRLVAKVLRDLVAAHRFADYADLKHGLWTRLKALKIRCAPIDVDEAITLIESNRPCVSGCHADAPLEALSTADADPPITPVEAVAILKRLGIGGGFRAIPSAPWTDPEEVEQCEEAARQRAMEMGIEL